MEFTIESGIAKPKSARGRKPTQFPLDQMEPGQSFLIPVESGDTKTLESWRRKVRVAAKAFSATYESKYNTATVPEGLRVFRME